MTYRPRDKYLREQFEECIAKYGEPKYRPRSGYKYEYGTMYTKGSVYGQKYMCPWCGREQLGVGRGNNHWSDCPVLVVRESEQQKKDSV